MARQVELALESRASFPATQLYYGYLPTARQCASHLIPDIFSR